MATELVDVTADEVSLVKRGANRKRFALVKGAGAQEETMPRYGPTGIAVLTERLNKATEGEDAVIAAIADLHKAAGKPFGDPEEVAARALLSLAGDSSQPEAMRAALVAGLMGVEKASDGSDTQAKCTKCSGAMAKGDKFCKACGTAAAVSKADDKEATVATTVPETLQKLAEANPAYAVAIAKAAEGDGAMLVVLEPILKQAEAMREAMGGLLNERAQSIALQKAEATGLQGDKEKLATVLAKADAAGIGDEVFEILKATGAQINAQKLFGELGSSAVGPADGSAEAEAEMRATQMVAKAADGKLTKEDAMVAVYRQDPTLYRRHLEEQRRKITAG